MSKIRNYAALLNVLFFFFVLRMLLGRSNTAHSSFFFPPFSLAHTPFRGGVTGMKALFPPFLCVLYAHFAFAPTSLHLHFRLETDSNF